METVAAATPTLVEAIDLTQDDAAYVILMDRPPHPATFPTAEKAMAALQKKRLRAARNKYRYKTTVIDLTTSAKVVAPKHVTLHLSAEFMNRCNPDCSDIEYDWNHSQPFPKSINDANDEDNASSKE
jgi:hypothetical protein